MSVSQVEPDETWALVERATAGDERAFGKLVERYQHEVYSVAMRMVNNPCLADDVAQEAFVRAWRSLETFRGDAAFGTWLHRITVNTALTQRTRRAKRAVTSLDDAPELVDATPGSDPSAFGDNLALAGELHSALARISPDQRTVVILKDVEGWSHREIATALGITVSATKVRLHRAHAKLRRLLGDRT